MDTFLSHLASKRAKLQKQLQKLQSDIADLDKAERLYQESGAALRVPPPPPPPFAMPALPLPPLPPAQFFGGGESVLPAALPGAGKTIKERVLQLLERNPQGLTSSQILSNLNADGGQPVSRESLSPQLSRLRGDDRKIDLDQGVWSLQKRENHAG